MQVKMNSRSQAGPSQLAGAGSSEALASRAISRTFATETLRRVSVKLPLPARARWLLAARGPQPRWQEDA